jgi:hypothetical protein
MAIFPSLKSNQQQPTSNASQQEVQLPQNTANPAQSNTPIQQNTVNPAQSNAPIQQNTVNPAQSNTLVEHNAAFNIEGVLSPTTTGKTALDHLLFSITTLPLWIRQVIYTDLRDALESEMSAKTIKHLDKQNFLQLWEPLLTNRGKNEVLNPSAAVSMDVQFLLKHCKNSLNVANICTELHWTLEKCCVLLCEAIAEGYLEPSTSITIDATMRYLGNKIRLGEYLVQSQRINVENMEQALRTQQYITVAMGEHTNIGEILVRLELVDQEDVEAILFLKEESSKVFKTTL